MFGPKTDHKQDDKPTGGLFGSSVGATGGLFGPKSDEKKDEKQTGGLSSSPQGGGGGLFGQKPEQKQDAKPTAAFSFGDSNKTTGGLFGQKTEEKKDDKTKSSFGFGSSTGENGLFGNKDGAKGFSFGNKGETGDGIFGKKEETKEHKPESDNKDTKPSLFSFGAAPTKDDNKAVNFSFEKPGEKKDDKKDEKPKLSFGAPLQPSGASQTDQKKNEANEKQGGGLFGTGAAKPSGGFSFGEKTEEKKDASSKPELKFGDSTKVGGQAPQSGLSFGQKKEDEKAPAKKEEDVTSVSATKDGPNMKPTKIAIEPVSLDNMTMDDLIIKWSKLLNTTSGIFDLYTKKVRQWDQQLVASGDEISKLYQDTMEVDTLQNKIDQQLFFVENQQDELDKLLDNYEAQADILLSNIEMNNSASEYGNAFPTIGTPSGSSGLSFTDELREKAYHNAELLDERLDHTSHSLSTLINEINSVSDSYNKDLLVNLSYAVANAEEKNQVNKGTENPIEEIVKLLNLHLENLKYISKSEEVLKERLSKIK